MTTDLFLLAARILLSLMFLSSGAAALSNIDGTAGYFAGLGMPAPMLLAWMVGIFELAGGLLLALGLQTGVTATLLALFSVTATFLGHYGQGDEPRLVFMHGQALLKDIAVAGGLIVLAIHGPGGLSADAWLGRFRRSGASPRHP